MRNCARKYKWKKWKRRALRAEEKLRTEETSVVYLAVRVNGKFKTRYTIQATKLASASFNLDQGHTVEARGNGTTFTIDIPITVDP